MPPENTSQSVLKEMHTHRVVLPLNTPIISGIHRIEAIHALVTRLIDDNGHEGFGITVAFSPHYIESMEAIVRDAAPLLEEHPLDRIGAIRDAFFKRTNYIGWSGVAVQALNTIDTALWVLLAERSGLPLYKLLGAVTNRLECYQSSGLWLGNTGQGLIDEAMQYVDDGYGAIKLRVGIGELSGDLDRVEQVRKAIGPDIKLILDVNQGFEPLYAYKFGRALDPYDIFWFEEPVPYTDVATHARLAAELQTPIATGQTEYLQAGMMRYLEGKACQIIMPDIGRMGGVTGWRKAVALAEAYQVTVSNHIYPEFGLHLLASTPNRTLTDYMDWLEPLFHEPLHVDGGWVTLSDEPGIGMQLDPKALEKFRVSA